MLLRSLSRFFVAFAWLGRLRVVLDSPKNLILQTYCIWLEYITLLWFVKSFLIIFSWLKLIPNVQVWKYRCLESVWTSLFPKSSQLNVSNIPQPPRSIYIHRLLRIELDFHPRPSHQISLWETSQTNSTKKQDPPSKNYSSHGTKAKHVHDTIR